MPKKIFRIIFMGTPHFAVPSLKALIAHGEQIVCVVSQPDRPKGRGRKLSTPPVKDVAAHFGIPILQSAKIKGEDFPANLKEFHPDLIIVAAYGRILPAHIINMPTLGTINVHASLLPKYRGAAPVQWALINGEAETGVTIMQMDEGLDTGDILLTEKIPIDHEDSAASLMVKLADLGSLALIKALDLLRAGKLKPVKQDNSLATLAPPLTKKNGLADWTKPAFEISCLMRGLDPWPAIYTMFKGKRLRLFAPQVISDSFECSHREQGKPLLPGTLCRADSDGLVISTGMDYLLVREIQPEGGRRMTVDAYLRGHTLDVGLIFG